ncbi:MAG: hypothetical protein PVG22_03835, partial [Chromatiales bacterium]
PVYFVKMVHQLGDLRYRPNGTSLRAHGGVATAWNRVTIPRRCALLCTPLDAPFNLSNCGFKDY